MPRPKMQYWRKCPVCGHETTNEKYCSEACYRKGSRRAARPSKEELAKLVWELPTTKIAEKYGVTDKAVSKWCQSYGIDKPPRGYWTGKKRKAEDDGQDLSGEVHF